MRLTLILPYPAFGAAEDYACVLASSISETTETSVKILHIAGIVPLASRKALEDSGVALVAIDRHDMNSTWRLRRRLRTLNASIIHINQVHLPAIVAAGRCPGSAVVVTAHNPALAPHYSIKGRMMDSMASRSADRWITLSSRNKGLLQRRVSSSRIQIIPPGLPLQRFTDLADRRSARDVLDLSQDAFVVGTVGRLSRQKRHDLMIQAAADAVETVPSLQVAIFGEGELRDEMLTLAEDIMPGRVHLLGHR